MSAHLQSPLQRVVVVFALLAICLWNVTLWNSFLGRIGDLTDDIQPAGTSHREKNDDILLSKATDTAIRIARNDFRQEIIPEEAKISVAEWVLDARFFVGSNGSSCHTVYSFGVGSDDPWTNFMAEHCEKVFAFDPTVTKYHHPNVMFFPWGLRNSDKNWSHPVYGSPVATSRYMTFPQLQLALSHDSSHSLSALKFDCEGCEYGAFEDGVPPARYIFTEFHLSVTLGMESMKDIVRLNAVSSYLSHCKVISYRPNRGFRRDRAVLPYLVEHGIKNGTCCYEYAFRCDDFDIDH